MTLETVIANLENTIVGKQKLLDNMIYYSDAINNVTREFIKLNINELTKILEDLKAID